MEGEQGKDVTRLPNITEETCNRLLQDSSLDLDPGTKRIITSITGEVERLPKDICKELAENLFSDLIAINFRGLKALGIVF